MKKKKTIVVKIGSSSLTNKTGGLCVEQLTEHVEALVNLKNQGHDVLLITSGAVAAGFNSLNYPTRPVTISGKQAAASVGQGLLMHHYTEAFKKHHLVVGQVLLTRHSFAYKDQYKHIYTTLVELLKRDIIPIINENDTVSVDELTFGDNDMLSALVSGMMHADYLMMLTDIDGLYDKNPHNNHEAKRYQYLSDVSQELFDGASDTSSKVGTGGMLSKLEAARTAHSLGVQVFIGSGSGNMKLIDILDGKGEGTYIGQANLLKLRQAKQWLSFHSTPTGQIEVDQGAADAILKRGKSLLPAGITRIFGPFKKNDVVEVTNIKGEIIGKGQVRFSSIELDKLKGHSSKDFAGRQHNDYVVIHRDQWVSNN